MIWALYAVLVALSFADAESTRCALSYGHEEFNPIVAVLIKRFGFSAVYYLKGSALCFLGFMLSTLKWTPEEITWVKGAMLAVVIFYSMVVFSNITLIGISN